MPLAISRHDLDRRIAALHPDVSPELRVGLSLQFRTLRETGNARAVLVAMSPLCLQFVRLVYGGANERTPSDNLFDCLTRATGGDPSRKIEGLRLIPDEVASGLHTIRVLSNKSDHAAEGVTLGVADAENALGLFLRAFEWYSVEYPRGPRMPAFYRRRRWPLAVGLAVTSAALGALGIVGYGAIRPPSQVPDPESKPATSKAGGPGPESQVELKLPEAKPRILLQLLVDRGRKANYVDLPDGAPIASDVDDYLIVAQPQTSGYLYVFQVDARGGTTWLFPANPTSNLSSGSNPVVPGVALQMPSPELQSALYLDDHRGDEHIYAVFSANRWGELEDRLASRSPGATLASLTGAAGRTRAPKGVRPKAQSFEVGRNGVTLRIDGFEYEASDRILIVDRWFRHE